MFIRTTSIGTEVILAASFSDARVVLVDYHDHRLLGTIRIPANCEGRYAFSADERQVVTGYDRAVIQEIEWWDFAHGRVIARCALTGVLDLACSADASVVYVATIHGSCLCARAGGDPVRLRATDALAWEGDVAASRDTLLLPSTFKSEVLRLDLRGFCAERCPVPLAHARKMVWCVRRSPRDGAVVAVESDGRDLCCFDPSLSTLHWHRSFPDACFSTVTFSGNGAYVGINAGERPGERMIVVDAHSGETIREFASPCPADHPFVGATVLCESGAILDLETGEVDETMTEPKWWRAMGL